MANPEPDPSAPLPPDLEAALRDALLEKGNVMPRTPADVAAFDARHGRSAEHTAPGDPAVVAFLKKWEATREQSGAQLQGETLENLALAARSGKNISAESRAQIAAMIRKLSAPPSNDSPRKPGGT